MNIAKRLEENAHKYLKKTALIFKDKRVNFLELKDLTFKLKEAFKNLGLKKTDKVAIYLPNCPEYVYTYLAIFSLGLVAVPLDFMLTEEELVSCISHAQAKILIAKEKPSLSFISLKKKIPQLEKIILCGEKKEGFLTFEELLESSPEEILPPEDIDDKAQAIIFYTSGTTGKPKGVLINYRQLSAPMQAVSYFTELNDKDICLCAIPFSHIAGLMFVQAIVFLGASVVLMERFIPVEFLKLVEEYKVTIFWLVPAMYYALLHLKEFEVFDLSSLKTVVCFGAPSSPEQLKRFHQYCPNADLINGWGMTETQGPTVVLPRGSSKVESVGKPAPWIEVKIFSAEGGCGGDESEKELPIGEVGEIVVRSWVVTDGYYKDPELTAQTKRNGWFHTGDLGRFDKDGFLYIVGRKKEMIKVAGEIVFEPEVEAAIYKHPAVKEVAVVGVEDKLRGEVPYAFVVLKDNLKLTAEELRYFLRQHLGHFKIPHYFEFRDELPKNRTGKIDKETLRNEAKLAQG